MPMCRRTALLRCGWTMMTINAEEHPLMPRFHKPGAEKRSVAVLQPEQYDDWLGCRSTNEARVSQPVSS
jgi:putative SOS response-associated peptidase YedK